MNNKIFHLDSNAHIKLSPQIFEIYHKYSDYFAGHPLAFHSLGRKASVLMEGSREKIAELLGATSKEQIIFTRGTSQAIEWGLEIFKKFGNFSFSNLEHFAVVDKVNQLQNENFYSKYLELNQNTFDIDLCPTDSLVHIFAHNETGVIYDLNQYPKKLFSDCAQIIGKNKFNLSNYPNLEIATFSPHKFGAPAGIGILYLKNIENWQEFGTGSRYNFDITGTPDIFGIAATAEILASVFKEQNEKIKKMTEFQNTIEKGFKELGCEIIAENLSRLPNTTFLKLPKKWAVTENKFKLLQKMEEKEIYPGLGSACGAIHNFENRVMKSVGYPESADNYLRFSTFGEYDSSNAEQIISIISDIFQAE